MVKKNTSKSKVTLTRRQIIKGFGTAALGALITPATLFAENETNSSARHYVLVHGAWHGGWAWKDVAKGLRQLGHSVSTPTLAGLGERFHVEAAQIGLNTHIQDINAHLEMEDLKDVVLVGHSYAGMVIAGTIGEKTGRVKSAVFFDAFLPEPGKGLADYIPPKGKVNFEKLHSEKKLVPPPPHKSWGKRWGLTDPRLINWVKKRIRPQSAMTFLEPVKNDFILNDVDYTYIRCEQNPNPFFAKAAEKIKHDPKWKYIGIDSHHEAMMLVPSKVIDILNKI